MRRYRGLYHWPLVEVVIWGEVAALAALALLPLVGGLLVLAQGG